ncbi:hypothetical protein HY637_01670 [Candidatus Woesearchaeota archaeon]|nr:hypothetical protein [Candidatus Woesearchaeota archaeon]
MAIVFPTYNDPIQQIANIESRARYARNGEAIEENEAIRDIKEIIGRTRDKATAIYGLRALSRLGVRQGHLIGMAVEYNKASMPATLYDRNLVSYVIVEDNRGFREVGLDGRVLREVNFENAA